MRKAILMSVVFVFGLFVFVRAQETVNSVEREMNGYTREPGGYQKVISDYQRIPDTQGRMIEEYMGIPAEYQSTPSNDERPLKDHEHTRPDPQWAEVYYEEEGKPSTGDDQDTLENAINHPVVDSAMTLEEALDGLNPGCPEDIRAHQTLVDVLHYSLDGLIHKGQIVMDGRLADDLRRVFQVALEEKFPLASVIPISQFGWDDHESMAQNNTSGFNYRAVTGGKTLSNHAYGFAIDMNPLFNPYIKDDVTLPMDAVYDPEQAGTLTADHAIVRTFLRLGWKWGGHWQSLKDYQHFEKVPEE